MLSFFVLQMIHFITMALGGEGYLNFMGNEVSLIPNSSGNLAIITL